MARGCVVPTTNAREILAAKIALEIELVQPLGYALSSYIETWARQDGRLSMADQIAFAGMVESVLMRHYARTIAVMSGTVPTEETTLDQVVLVPSMAVRLKNRARNQTMHMLRGIDRDLAAVMATMPVLHEAKGATFEVKKTRLTMALAGRFKETAKQAWAKLKSRMRAIVNLETEAVAEQHQIEWVKQKHANSRIFKTWNSLMDGKERPTHHAAHGQEVPVTQPFEVGDAKLMQPGDSSLGAPLSEVINCRCWCTYAVVGPNGERVPIPLQTPALPAKRRWRPGDRLGIETPVRPTEAITMSGRTRANVVLGDGRTFAQMVQTAPDTVVVRVQGRDVARAQFDGDRVVSMTLAPGTEAYDLDGLIRRSVEATSRFLTSRR